LFSLFYQVKWNRVIIDEGHALNANPTSTNWGKLATALSCNCRWIVTGTPAESNALQLSGQLEFIKWMDAHQKFWKQKVMNPLSATIGDDEKTVGRDQVRVVNRLKQALQEIQIRHTKKNIPKGLILPMLVETVRD
jgi:SNF2 family DNA or RNA helicase